MKQKKRPLIGISANIEKIDKEPFLGQERAVLHQTYIEAVAKSGGTPLMLPIVEDEDCIRQQISLLDGIIFSGGYDLQPSLYGQEPHPLIGRTYPKRDEYELKALNIAYERRLPIFGICRGAQLINVAFGGSLHQDVSQHESYDLIEHTQKAEGHIAWHTVEIIPDTQLHDIFKKERLAVNSFHHQTIKDLAPSFSISAKAQDGIIEGIEKVDYPFLICVQWHPERMVDHHPDMLSLFQALILKSSESKSFLP